MSSLTDDLAEHGKIVHDAAERAGPPKESERIEHCSCTWVQFESGMAECGCGDTHIRIYRDDDTYHFEKKHWSSECLIEELLKRLGLPGIAEDEARCHAKSEAV